MGFCRMHWIIFTRQLFIVLFPYFSGSIKLWSSHFVPNSFYISLPQRHFYILAVLLCFRSLYIRFASEFIVIRTRPLNKNNSVQFYLVFSPPTHEIVACGINTQQSVFIAEWVSQRLLKVEKMQFIDQSWESHCPKALSPLSRFAVHLVINIQFFVLIPAEVHWSGALCHSPEQLIKTVINGVCPPRIILIHFCLKDSWLFSPLWGRTATLVWKICEQWLSFRTRVTQVIGFYNLVCRFSLCL